MSMQTNLLKGRLNWIDLYIPIETRTKDSVSTEAQTELILKSDTDSYYIHYTVLYKLAIIFINVSFALLVTSTL